MGEHRTRLAPEKAGLDKLDKLHFMYVILMFVADGLERVPRVYLFHQKFAALVSNNYV